MVGPELLDVRNLRHQESVPSLRGRVPHRTSNCASRELASATTTFTSQFKPFHTKNLTIPHTRQSRQDGERTR